jgi:hypothetical protein
MGTEGQNSKEERIRQIEEELANIRKQASDNPAESKQLFDKMNILERELFELKPPSLTPK